MRDRELQSQNEKEEEEGQSLETLTHVDIVSKEQKRIQEENRGKFLSMTEKIVSPEGFQYYVDRSSVNHGGDDCLFKSDLDYEVSEDEETEQFSVFVGGIQETGLKDAHLMTPEFSSLEKGGEFNLREIESTYRIFAVCLAEDNLGANFAEKNGTVFEEVPCIVEKRDCASSGDKEESFRNEYKVQRKIVPVRPTSVSSGRWLSID